MVWTREPGNKTEELERKRENKPFSEQLIALRTKQSHTDGSLSTPYQDISINKKLNKDKYKQIE
jgi:hypothetical protein